MLLALHMPLMLCHHPSLTLKSGQRAELEHMSRPSLLSINAPRLPMRPLDVLVMSPFCLHTADDELHVVIDAAAAASKIGSAIPAQSQITETSHYGNDWHCI